MSFIKNICSLPLHQILYDNGYEIDKDSYSKNNPVFKDKNFGGNIIISRKRDKAGNEIYLYFNTKHEKDKGNILNFCANRQLKIEEFIKGKSDIDKIKVKLQDIGIKNTDTKTISKEFNKLPQYSMSDDVILQNRGIYTSLAKEYSKSLKQDDFGNLCIPNYHLQTINHLKNIQQCGITKRLKTPLYKDQDGNLRKKPLKFFCKGQKGMEILLPNIAIDTKFKDIKTLIISESIIDSLSFIQLRNLNPQETIPLSTAGNFEKEKTSEILMELISKIQKFKEENKQAGIYNQIGIYIAMDNDNDGKKFSNFLETEIVKKLHRMPTIYQPFTKDCNDDLKVSQIIGKNKVNHQSIMDFCQSKINEYKVSQSTNKKRSILEDFRKLDAFQVLPQKIKELFNSIDKHKSIKKF